MKNRCMRAAAGLLAIVVGVVISGSGCSCGSEETMDEDAPRQPDAGGDPGTQEDGGEDGQGTEDSGQRDSGVADGSGRVPMIVPAPGGRYFATKDVGVMSVRRGVHAIGWVVGLDESCILVDAVNEVRSRYAGSGSIEPTEETGLAMLIWVERLLKENGVAYSDPEYDAFIGELGRGPRDDPPRDEKEVRRHVRPAFDNLGLFEQRDHFIADFSGARCPKVLSPGIQFDMPDGDYLVDWVESATGKLKETVPLEGGKAILVPPTFERHLAVIVRPR